MPRRRFSFILRLWTEMAGSSANLQPTLRGSLQRADSDLVRYFGSFDEIPAILREMTEWHEMLDSPLEEDNA